jgi:hypothetical protein
MTLHALKTNTEFPSLPNLSKNSTGPAAFPGDDDQSMGSAPTAPNSENHSK